MKNLLYDVRYSFRLMMKNVWFTILVVIILAVGIGANGAIFSAINSVLMRPLPYAEPERLVAISTNLPSSGTFQASSSSAEYLHLRNHGKSFSGVAGFSSPISYNLSGVAEPERIQSIYVTENFFSVLGAQPLLGRTFVEQDQNPGLTTLAVISHGLWTRRFGADPAAVGKTVLLDTEPFTVVGVMPPGFRHPTPLASLDVEVWVAAGFVGPPFEPPAVENRMMRLIGRLRPGVPVEQARAEMEALGGQLQAQYPDRYPADSGFNLDMRTLHESVVGDFRPVFLILLATVTIVLLIACTNIANLLLSKANARKGEMAIRAALGASRSRLIRQLLTESFMLSLLGAAVGLLLTVQLTQLLSALGQQYIPGLADASLDWRVLAYTLLVSVVTAILFGVAPALQISSPKVNEALKDGTRGSTGGVRHGKASSLLVVMEFSLALLLLVGAGLLLKSFWQLREVELGFNPDNLLTMQIALPFPTNLEGARYGAPAQRAAFYRQLLERLHALPDVESAAIVTALPMTAPPLMSQRNYPVITIRGREVKSSADLAKAEWHLVSPEYFHTIGARILRGRGVSEEDRIDAPPRVVVNQAFAQKYFGSDEAVGKYLKIGDETMGSPWMEIIGVLANFKNEGMDRDTIPELYVPYQQLPEANMSLVVRTAGAPENMTRAVVGAVRSVDPDQPVFQVRTMNEIMNSSLGVRNFSTVLLGVFAAVAIFLAAIGIYGVMSYYVTQRSREIGIRMALGAQQGDILRLILLRGLILSAIGISVGVLLALTATRLMSSLLYSVAPLDPAIFAAAAATLLGVGLAACWLPATRATRVNPVATLRG